MSADEEKAKPSVCDNFEPQAWRKTICKNCFQAPEKHVVGDGATASSSGGKENKPPAVADKPKASKTGVEDKTVGNKGEIDKPGKALAHSIKDKYEQLEKEKHGAKEPPKVAPKSTKVKTGLSAITDKYEHLKVDSKANDNIPSSNAKKIGVSKGAGDTKFLAKKDEKPDAPKSLIKSKYGSTENVSKLDEKQQKVESKFGQKSKFGSMENVSNTDKQKEPIQIPIQRSKFGGSVDSLSSKKETQSSGNSELSKRSLLNKLDTFSNELKAGATSKVGSTVIHKQTDGKVEVITIPKKTNAPKQLDNESLQNEMNELKMSRIGDKSGQIKSQQDSHDKSDVNSKIIQTSTGQKQGSSGTTSPTKSISPERKPGFKLEIGKTDESENVKQLVRRNSGFKLNIGTESPEIKPGFKIEYRKSESPTKDPARRNSGFKLEIVQSESPTKEPPINSPEKKPSGFKLNFGKSESPTKEPQGDNGLKKDKSPSISPTKEVNNSDDKSKFDLRSGLKKTESKQNETSKLDLTKTEGKQKFEVPKLKSSKDKTENGKLSGNEKRGDTQQEMVDIKHEDKLKDNKKSTLDKEPKRNDRETESNKTIHTFSLSSQKESVTVDDKTANEHVTNKNNTEVKTIESKLESVNKDKPSVNSRDSKEIADVQNNNKTQDLENNISVSNSKVEENTSVSRSSDQNKVEESKNKFDKEGKADKLGEIGSTKSGKEEIVKQVETGRLNTDSTKHTKPITDDKKTQSHDAQKKEELKKKVESPFLKSSNDTKKSIPETKSNRTFEVPKLKSARTDEKDSKQVKPEPKSDEPKRKFEIPNLKSSRDEKDKRVDTKFDSKQDEPKRKFEVPSLKSNKDANENIASKKLATQEEPKRKFEVPSLKSSKEEKDKKADTDKKVETKSDEHKRKFEIPNLKSSKQDDKSKVTDKQDLKPDDKKKMFEVPKLKSTKAGETPKKEDPSSALKRTEPTKKFESTSLKSPKGDDKAKPVEKIGFANLRSTKDDKKENTSKSELDAKKPNQGEDKVTSKTFEMPKLRSKQDLSSKESKSEEETTKSKEDSKDISKKDTSHNKVNDFHTKQKGGDERESQGSTEIDKTNTNDVPSPLSIGAETFDIISADSKANTLPDEDDACAGDSASDGNYVHVDTQVFTSSRNKAAGVTGLDECNLATTGVSDGVLSKQESKADTNDTVQTTDTHSNESHNGEISSVWSIEHISDEPDNIRKGITSEGRDDRSGADADELARFKKELLLMTERCKSLQKENISLVDSLDKKDDDQLAFKKQKHDLDALVNTLKGQLDAVISSCDQLETENKNLTNSLKAQEERIEVNEEKIRSDRQRDVKEGKEREINANRDQEQVKENVDGNANDAMEELAEENEHLKQEINDLKLEMDEMYDSFRDQEFEEFRELQKELEITAKNCRILQFKVRKLERHADQVEQDRNQYEDRLRRLQDQFADRDAVSHIHSLEDELRMAKDVSVRLHDELDLVEEKRGKMEEENRHLTELLEQADRKQFRLELEVDKLRDKVMQLRTELNSLKDGPNAEPRKLNCAEFLAIHREVV